MIFQKSGCKQKNSYLKLSNNQNMKNAQFHTNNVKSVCENKLEIDFRSGKEYNGWFWLNGKKKKRITIPKGRKPIPPKTYKTMALQLGLHVNEFDSLLECPLTKESYEQLISER
jgi:hypothetical protein